MDLLELKKLFFKNACRFCAEFYAENFLKFSLIHHVGVTTATVYFCENDQQLSNRDPKLSRLSLQEVFGLFIIIRKYLEGKYLNYLSKLNGFDLVEKRLSFAGFTTPRLFKVEACSGNFCFLLKIAEK